MEIRSVCLLFAPDTYIITNSFQVPFGKKLSKKALVNAIIPLITDRPA